MAILIFFLFQYIYCWPRLHRSSTCPSVPCTTYDYISKTKQHRIYYWTLCRSWDHWFCCCIQILSQMPPWGDILMLSAVVNGVRCWEPVIHNHLPLCWQWQSHTGSRPASFHSVIFLLHQVKQLQLNSRDSWIKSDISKMLLGYSLFCWLLRISL